MALARQSKLILGFIAVVAVLAGVGLWYQSVSTAQTQLSAAAGGVLPAVGHRAPDFQVTDLSGKKVKLSDFKGKPVFLNFWATWCSFCRAEMPAIAEAYRDFGASGKVAFLLVNSGESAAAARKYLSENGYTLPVGLDGDGQVTQRYLVRGLPSSFFIGPDGVIRDKVEGALDARGLRTRLALLVP